MKITARKYEGDDAGSWAIFVDGRPVMTGLTRREVPYAKKQATERFADKKEVSNEPE